MLLCFNTNGGVTDAFRNHVGSLGVVDAERQECIAVTYDGFPPVAVVQIHLTDVLPNHCDCHITLTDSSQLAVKVGDDTDRSTLVHQKIDGDGELTIVLTIRKVHQIDEQHGEEQSNDELECIMAIGELTEIRTRPLPRQEKVNIVGGQQVADLFTLQQVQADGQVCNEVAPQVCGSGFSGLIGTQTRLFIDRNLLVVKHGIEKLCSIVVHQVVVDRADILIFLRHIFADETAQNECCQQRFRSVLVDTLCFGIHDIGDNDMRKHLSRCLNHLAVTHRLQTVPAIRKAQILEVQDTNTIAGVHK